MTIGLRQQAEDLAERLMSAFRVVIDTVDDDWGVRAELHGDTTLSERLLELIQHWGYLSRPAKGAEGVAIEDESGIAILGTRATLPGTVANNLPTSGNTMLYNANGKRIYLKDGKIQLHPDGTLKAVARHDDKCPVDTLMATWLTQVETAVNSLSAPATPIAPLSPTFSGTSIAKINATSTVTESG